ncbi:MAG: PrsW family glutamic-type intramembrane protease [Terracidiphilus sp.]
MLCPRCGTESQPDNKFCKSCGAALGAAAGPQSVAPPAGPPPPPPGATTYTAPPPPMGGMPPQAPPPGMVPMVYQAYPGGPQQVYYVPAPGKQAHAGSGVMGDLTAKIRQLASTDKLEGFSLTEIFKETFKKHGPDAVEEYLGVGSPRSTPPLEMVDTNWPKPWMFFRVLAGLAVAYAAIYALYIYTGNEKPMIAIMVLATFAVPMATLTFLWEMNTPRNVSVIEVIKLFVVGGGIAVVLITVGYITPLFSAGAFYQAGILEESSKLLAVIIVTWGARGARYPYQLNGILFGATVGAAFACSETLGYGMDAFAPGLVAFVKNGGLDQIFAGLPQGATVGWGIILMPVMKATLMELNVRAILSPFGHIVWTGIAAGAFWRVKGDRPANFSMLIDGRFLRAFIIPVILHALWDSPLAAGSSNLALSYGGMAVIAVISWYVMFTMIQQGLHQVRDMQKAQLEHTLQHVEATLGLGTVRPPMPPGPVAVAPVA